MELIRSQPYSMRENRAKILRMKSSRIAMFVSLAALPLFAAGCASQGTSSVASNAAPVPVPVAQADKTPCTVFTKLSDALKNPDAVCELNLSNQGLTETLPSQIGKMQNMKILNVSGNKMTNLPAEIGQLKQLEVLDVSRNYLTGLPMEIGDLPNLKKFSVQGNAYSVIDMTAIMKKLSPNVSVWK